MISAIGFYQMKEEQGFEELVKGYLDYSKTQEDLDTAAKALRAKFWQLQKPFGVVNVGDFTFYDNVWDLLSLLGAKNEAQKACSSVKSYHQAKVLNNEHLAKHRWLDSEFFVIKPEFNEAASYELNTKELFSHYNEAKALGYKVKFTLFGVFSPLFFAKLASDDEKAAFKKFKSSYFNLIEAIAQLEKGVEIDFNELAFSAARDEKMTQTLRCTLGMPAVECIYDRFEKKGVRVCVNTFEYNEDLLRILLTTSVSGVGFDANKTPTNELLEALGKSGKNVKLGIIGFENLSKNDLNSAKKSLNLDENSLNFDKKLELLKHYLQFIPKERLILSLSNRLLQSDFAYIKAHSDFAEYDEFINAKISELIALENVFKSL